MMKQLLTASLMLLNICTSQAQAGFELSATEIAAQMGIGWNLGNTLEAGNNAHNFTNKGGLGAETAWQSTKTTQETIDYIKSLGFKSIRIPCAWVMGHISNANDYTIDTAWLNRVKEVVDYCIRAGLYVVINDHWDGGWLEEHIKDTDNNAIARNKAILHALWTQIATEFRDYDEHLLFAGLNEPNAETQSATNNLIAYEQTFIDAVRATGGNNERRILVLQGPSTNIEHTDKFYNNMPTDPSGVADRLMMEIHYYNPWQFWGMEKDESWGKVFYYWGEGNHVSGSQHNPNWDCEEGNMEYLLRLMKTKFVDKGIPVIIGEFGANWRTITGQGESQEKHNASIKTHYKTLCQLALEMGMVPMVWDTNYCNRPSMTIVNRNTRSVYNTYMMEGISEAMQATAIARPPLINSLRHSPHTYNLQGQVMPEWQQARGLYIVSGRKVVR